MYFGDIRDTYVTPEIYLEYMRVKIEREIDSNRKYFTINLCMHK